MEPGARARDPHKIAGSVSAAVTTVSKSETARMSRHGIQVSVVCRIRISSFLHDHSPTRYAPCLCMFDIPGVKSDSSPLVLTSPADNLIRCDHHVVMECGWTFLSVVDWFAFLKVIRSTPPVSRIFGGFSGNHLLSPPICFCSFAARNSFCAVVSRLSDHSAHARSFGSCNVWGFHL